MRTFTSPAGLIRLELSVETVWVGETVYPDVAVWRLRYRDRPVTATSFFRLRGAGGEPVAYGMTLTEVRERAAARAALFDARWVDRAGDGFTVTFVLTDLPPEESGPYDLPQLACTWAIKPDASAENMRDDSLIAFPDGSCPFNPGVGDDLPDHLFSPDGKVIVHWRRPFLGQLFFFDRPGDLAVARIPLGQRREVWEVTDPQTAVTELFTLAPHLSALPLAIRFACEGLTPAFQAAYRWMVEVDPACEVNWLLRGEPGAFAVWARRKGDTWQIAGVSVTERVLTVRLEDLIGRTPGATADDPVRIALLRDPNKNETGLDSVSESFDALPFATKIVLEVKAGGGFLITVHP